jgi:hypothetical protein
MVSLKQIYAFFSKRRPRKLPTSVQLVWLRGRQQHPSYFSELWACNSIQGISRTHDTTFAQVVEPLFRITIIWCFVDRLSSQWWKERNRQNDIRRVIVFTC